MCEDSGRIYRIGVLLSSPNRSLKPYIERGIPSSARDPFSLIIYKPTSYGFEFKLKLNDFNSFILLRTPIKINFYYGQVKCTNENQYCIFWQSILHLWKSILHLWQKINFTFMKINFAPMKFYFTMVGNTIQTINSPIRMRVLLVTQWS